MSRRLIGRTIPSQGACIMVETDDLMRGVARSCNRPGLPKFMEEMSRIYEMHVYTMGTRNYAEAIVKAVDPDGKYFGGRIVSRDENGSEFYQTVSQVVYSTVHLALDSPVPDQQASTPRICNVYSPPTRAWWLSSMIDQTFGAMYQTWSKSYHVSLFPKRDKLHPL